MRKPVLVADVGLNHEGDLARALRIVCLAKSCGVDYVKFQCRANIDACYTKEYLDRPKKTRFGTTVRDEKRGLEFGQREFERIAAFCKEQGIGWFASPRGADSVRFLQQFDPPYMKVASGSIPDEPMLAAIKDTGIPVILSTGMAYRSEIARAVAMLSPRYILHAVSLYPTPPKKIEMFRIRTLRNLFPGANIGFSNHSVNIIYLIQAFLVGADMLEFHLTDDRDTGGADQKASIGPTGLRRIVDHIGHICEGFGTGIIEPDPEELVKGNHYAWRQSCARNTPA
uniref:Putative N-acetylneuraminate synthase n=1 Tax=viral metagenome TaxID=1070528 RepID=A0A6H1ZG52_9ZZZZ